MMKKVYAVLDGSHVYGKERANIEVYRVLKEGDFNVRVGISKYATQELLNEVKDFNYDVLPYPFKITGSFRIIRYVWNFIKIQFELPRILRSYHPDYLLIPTEWALTYLFFVLARTKVKVIFRCGDDPITYRKRGKFATKIYGYLWRNYILKRVDVLVCNAKYIQKRLKESGRKDLGYDRLIYNYPPERSYATDDFKPVPFDSAALKVGIIGRIVPEKGVRELIEAVNLNRQEGRNIFVYIAGDENYDSAYTQEIEDCIQKYGLEKNVSFVGKLKNVNHFYQHCDVIAIPSIYEEPMANVVAESKSFHKACIIFNQGGMPEIVEHGKTGFICEKVNVEELARALSYYHDNPERVKAEGEMAFESISYLHLTKEDYRRRWIEVFSLEL